MPILATVGNRFVELLHNIIFSFPSPNTTLDAVGEPQQHSGHKGELGYATMQGDSGDFEPGEPKALAGGVGPLSFAGSGYGITLVLVVCALAFRKARLTVDRDYSSIVYTTLLGDHDIRHLHNLIPQFRDTTEPEQYVSDRCDPPAQS